MANLLVIDDEQSICWGIAKLGESMGHSVVTGASAERGLELVESQTPDLIVLDVRLPGMDGLTAMVRFQRLTAAPIIVITAFGDMQTAVAAVQNGAQEYLLKPFELSDARQAIKRALHREPTVDTQAPEVNQSEMIGDSSVMQVLYRQIALAADSQANILLRGESGVGKELAARAIHRHSSRADSPFVAVNVAALSESVAESELFGHVDGAFTGANRRREGLLVRANGGTLFLDEVADIPLPIQVILLRAIEEQEVLPVGADAPVRSCFRVVAATHQDLLALMSAGAFRRDLYFRIAAFEIALPPLRARSEDIPALAASFASRLGRPHVSIAESTITELRRRPWRGNVRELRNAIEHAMVLARSGAILPEHLPPPQSVDQESLNHETDRRQNSVPEASRKRVDDLLDDPASQGAIYETMLAELERPMLLRALQRHDNECAPAARALGLHRTTLKKKLDAYNLSE